MMYPRDNGQDDGPSVAQYQTLYISGSTYIYVITSMPGDLSSYAHNAQTPYTSTTTQSTASKPTDPIPAGQSAPATTPPPITPSNPNKYHDDDDGPGDGMAHGAKAVVVIVTLLGVAAIVLASIWFCCGGKARWARRKAARQQGAAVLPLHTISGQTQEQSRELPQSAAEPVVHPAGDLPPPSYEEVVPARHQRLAGGLPTRNEEEEEGDGLVVDGKTPLSEIPFEDVVLDHSPSGSSSSASSANQSFSARHHNQHGDTNGHTNS